MPTMTVYISQKNLDRLMEIRKHYQVKNSILKDIPVTRVVNILIQEWKPPKGGNNHVQG